METIYIIENKSKSYGEYWVNDTRQVVFPNEVKRSLVQPTTHTSNIVITTIHKNVSEVKPINKKKASEEKGEE